MSNSWRLIISPAAKGAWNMAVDEAILESVGHGESLPTFRLYAWEPACLSLGYSQSLLDVDLPRLHARGWQLVRRLTGGKAVLHIDEITYSICAPHHEPRLAGTVIESYHRLGTALMEAMHLLGLTVKLQERVENTGKNTNPVCFDTPSTCEITFSGKKLIGSAQARRKEGILQHGSLPLSGDLTRILQVLSFPDEEHRSCAISHLQERATTLELATGHMVSWKQAAEAIIRAFQTALVFDLQPGELTPFEIKRALQLVDDKYAHLDWKR
jgi:lipoate-protein ligase A